MVICPDPEQRVLVASSHAVPGELDKGRSLQARATNSAARVFPPSPREKTGTTKNFSKNRGKINGGEKGAEVTLSFGPVFCHGT